MSEDIAVVIARIENAIQGTVMPSHSETLLLLAAARMALLERSWVAVGDRLPDVDAPVIYYFETVGMHLGNYLGVTDDGEATFAGRRGFLTGDVTHWMLAPAPPK